MLAAMLRPTVRRFGARRAFRMFVLGGLACALLAAASDAAAQGCRTPATVVQDTPVFQAPATQFNTASGWVYGRAIAVLAPNVKVFICASRTIRFGAMSQDWQEIAFWNGSQWLHGWVTAPSLRAAAGGARSPLYAWLSALVPSARAQPPRITVSPPPGAEAPPSEQGNVAGSSVAGADSGLLGFYVQLFACMVLGMLAKVGFDTLNLTGRIDWVRRLRMGIVPLLVSPIVFLGIMKSADATSSATVESFISVACIAFQNGFFWHTLFDRSGATPKPREAAAG